MNAPTLYARLEKTTDNVLARYAPEAIARNRKRHRDAVFYRDRDCREPYARIPWHHKNRPTTRKTVTINCTRYQVEWVANKDGAV